MEPTIGRIVHVFATGERIVAGIITDVHNATLVTIRTFDSHYEISEFVTLAQGSVCGHWNWPPQISVAQVPPSPITGKSATPANLNNAINPGVKQATAVTPVTNPGPMLVGGVSGPLSEIKK